MPAARRTLALVAALVAVGLGAPASWAQGLEDLPPTSELPQVEEPAPEEPAPEEPAPEEPAPEEPAPEEPAPAEPGRRAPAELADTGSDPRVVGLLGATILLAGVGLRLRTRPEIF